MRNRFDSVGAPRFCLRYARSLEKERTRLAGELLQLVGDLGEAGLGAAFVEIAAGRATDADAGNRLVADFYAKGSRLQGKPSA